MSDLLESLAERLQCAHLAVHAPIWNTDLVAPAPPQDVAQHIRSLTRELLWWMARERADARMLNRMRLKSGGPIVPFRVLLCPLREEGSTVGLLAAIRTRAAATLRDRRSGRAQRGRTRAAGAAARRRPEPDAGSHAGRSSTSRSHSASATASPRAWSTPILITCTPSTKSRAFWPATPYCGKSAACGSRGCCPRAASPVTWVGIASSPYCSVTR